MNQLTVIFRVCSFTIGYELLGIEINSRQEKSGEIPILESELSDVSNSFDLEPSFEAFHWDNDPKIKSKRFLSIWVNYNDLTTSSP